MAAVQNFRSALGGFNREDVVRYIEYMNNKHNSQIEQLNTQLLVAQEALIAAKAPDSSELKAQLDAALSRCAELETLLAADGNSTPIRGDELEAYRRAERAERLARDRASQIYAQTNAALADATLKVEAVSDGISSLTEQFTTQLQDAKIKLQEAVASMYAIRPEED